jgi:alpha-beta hydrolase superfamily lysophospholipase
MTTLAEYTLESTDRKNKLHVCKWLPQGGKVRAVLQLSHGIVEHIGRYDDFARFMAEHGFVVVGNSHLGHGKSAAGPEDKGFFAEKSGWGTVVADMHKLFETTQAEYPSLPYFLLGHSMGSFLTQTYLITYQDRLAGCILTGAGQQSQPLLGAAIILSGLMKMFLGPRNKSAGFQKMNFGPYNKRIPDYRTPYDWLSRDAENVDKYVADDDSGFTPTVGLYSDMLRGVRFNGFRKNVARMRKDLPVLIAVGAEDPVGEYGKGPRKIYRLYKDAGVADVTLKFYEGARHEILNETNRQEVYEDILTWINDRIC